MKIIGTTEISFEIEQLLNSTEHYLILVTPYLKLNQRLRVRLSDAFKRTESVFILHREKQLNYNDSKWLKSFDNINIFSVKNLHSKIYINEEVALISSMNLYEYSQINNHEIGVKIESVDDREYYKNTLNEVRIILESEYTDHKFNEILEGNEYYTMGALFWRLNDKYAFGNYNSGSPHLYKFMSDRAREIIEFDSNELYQDGTAVLRSTELGKERFRILERELKKFSN
ncbi:phospholipase D family protein [Tamlana sp. I1]|uniref:phospholipase D family protein n=1 Tax=Tamlana sp. I1 TaxID=2762061 RepID=UPI00188DFF5A|nr:phospholipase D family protein [Tamlana sp. I1]